MKTQCPSCGQKYDVEAGYVGQAVQCANCNANFIVKLMEQPQRNSGSETARRMKEYKVLTQKDKWFSGKFDPELLEQAINSYATQGWRVITAATASFPGFFSGNREEMVIIMERDR